MSSGRDRGSRRKRARREGDVRGQVGRHREAVRTSSVPAPPRLLPGRAPGGAGRASVQRPRDRLAQRRLARQAARHRRTVLPGRGSDGRGPRPPRGPRDLGRDRRPRRSARPPAPEAGDRDAPGARVPAPSGIRPRDRRRNDDAPAGEGPPPRACARGIGWPARHIRTDSCRTTRFYPKGGCCGWTPRRCEPRFLGEAGVRSRRARRFCWERTQGRRHGAACSREEGCARGARGCRTAPFSGKVDRPSRPELPAS